MIGIGLCVVYMGITGLTGEVGTILLLFSVIIGTLIGTAIDIDAESMLLLSGWRKSLSKKRAAPLPRGSSHALFYPARGAYTIMASLNAGLGDNAMLYTKAIIDLCVTMMLASTLGIGVMFSAAVIFVYQGALALFSGVLSPLLSDEMIGAFSCVGALLTIPLGTNMMGVTDIKIANYIPAIIAAPVVVWLMSWVSAL